MENNDKDLAPVEIDLNAAHSGKLDESWLGMFGSWVESILGAMFRGTSLPLNVRGTRTQVKSFADTLQKEKKFIEAYHKHGLSNPKTYKSKAELKKATSKFERSTGIKWPFK